MIGIKHFDNDGNLIKQSGAEAAIMHYCRYQERCHSEVKNKLHELGCNADEAGQYISVLIEQGVLNEERFAKLYAGGKFRMKQWGREKIRQHMKMKKISDYCIRKGLAEIDDGEYEKTLKDLAEKKILEVKSERNLFVKKSKVYNYLVQKGYERDLVMTRIKDSFEK